MSKKQTRSTRRNASSHQEFQQLANDKVRQKRQNTKNSKKQIPPEVIKTQQQTQKIEVNEEKIEKTVQANKEQNQTEFEPITKNILSQQYQSKNKRGKVNRKQKTKLNLHHQAITTILRQFQDHPTFNILSRARLRPSTRSQMQKIRQNLETKEYTLQQFQKDLSKIFNSFYQKSGVSQQTLAQTKYLHNLLKQKIEYLQKNYEDVVQSSQLNSQSLRRSVRSSKSASKNQAQEINYSEPKKKVGRRKKQTKNEQSKKLVGQQNRIPARPKNSQITLNEIAYIGFNIRKLRPKELQQICLKYCNESHQRFQGNSLSYSFDLQKFTKPVLFELQAHVKTLLRQRNIQYEQVHDQSEGQFIIQDDC